MLSPKLLTLCGGLRMDSNSKIRVTIKFYLFLIVSRKSTMYYSVNLEVLISIWTWCRGLRRILHSKTWVSIEQRSRCKSMISLFVTWIKRWLRRWGSFLRGRVSVDISLPLCRGCLISLEYWEQVWIMFKYERLPNICYWYGCLDHDNKDCDVWIENEGTLSEEDQQQFVLVCMLQLSWLRVKMKLLSRGSIEQRIIYHPKSQLRRVKVGAADGSFASKAPCPA